MRSPIKEVHGAVKIRPVQTISRKDCRSRRYRNRWCSWLGSWKEKAASWFDQETSRTVAATTSGSRRFLAVYQRRAGTSSSNWLRSSSRDARLRIRPKAGNRRLVLGSQQPLGRSRSAYRPVLPALYPVHRPKHIDFETLQSMLVELMTRSPVDDDHGLPPRSDSIREGMQQWRHEARLMAESSEAIRQTPCSRSEEIVRSHGDMES